MKSADRQARPGHHVTDEAVAFPVPTQGRIPLEGIQHALGSRLVEGAIQQGRNFLSSSYHLLFGAVSSKRPELRK